MAEKKTTNPTDKQIEEEAIRLFEEGTGTTFSEWPSEVHEERFKARAKESLNNKK